MVDEYSAALQQAEKDIGATAQIAFNVAKQSNIEAEKVVEGIWAYDVLNNRVYWSHSLFEMLGLLKQEAPLTLESMMALIPSEGRQSLEQVIRTSLSTGEPFEAEFEMHHGSGQNLPARIAGKVYLDAEGNPSRISGRIALITPLQQATRSLEKANRDLSDLRHVLDESTILSVTDRYGVITYINDALCRISQYSRDELMGETLEFMSTGCYPQNFFRKIWDALENGQIWRGEVKHRAKDGTYFWMDTTIVPLLDADGKPFQYVVVRHDITRQKTAEQEAQELKENMAQQVTQRTAELKNINLVQSREILKQGRELDEQKTIEAELKKSLKREKLTKHLIQLMNRSFEPEIILEIIVWELGTFFDVDRCLVVYSNEGGDVDKGLQLFAQYCRSEIIQPIREEEIPWHARRELADGVGTRERLRIILNASEPKDFPIELKAYLENNQVQSVFSIEIRYRGVTFGRLDLHQCRSPRIWAEEEISFLEILATHIGAALYQTRLYQQEKQAKHEAEEANRLKSKILSFVSHDFKNPLDSMKRFIDILENDKSDILSEKHREFIGYVAKGIYQLRNMVTDILDKARLAEGQITPSPEWIQINSFIDDLKPMLSSLASQRNVEISIDIQPDLAAIKADPTHLRQILINLLSNAVKYNRIDGKVFLRIYKSEDRQSAIFEVRDTGLGIPAVKLPQLFTEYFRGDLSQSNLVEGTGLGLAFIKKLIELHGGTIHVESVEGEGSVFTVHLPIR